MDKINAFRFCILKADYYFTFEKMKPTINDTNLFKKKLRSLSDDEKKKVSDHVRKLTNSFENGKSFFNKNVYQPYQFNLKNNLDSSLYTSKVSPTIRLIFSVDEDPLFNKMELTLFDITDENKEVNRFKKIGENIYRSENLLY